MNANILELYKALHPEDADVQEQDCRMVSLEEGAHKDFAMLARGKLLVFAETEAIIPDMLAARMMLHLAAAYENLGGASLPVPLPTPELYIVYVGDDAVKPDTPLQVEFGCFKMEATVLRGRTPPKFRINAHCPHCGEEHLWLDISLSDAEQEQYDRFYAEHPRGSGLDDLLVPPAVVVERKIRCGICRKTFSQSFGIWKSIRTSNMDGVGEIPVHDN